MPAHPLRQIPSPRRWLLRLGLACSLGAAGCGADLYGACADDRDCRGSLLCAHAAGEQLGYCSIPCCGDGDGECTPDPEECVDDAGVDGVCATTDYTIYDELEGVITDTRSECAPTCAADGDCPGDTAGGGDGICD